MAQKLNSLPEAGERFTLGECLGNGIDGNVYEAVDTESNNTRVAIKIQKLRPDTETFISEEYRILKDFSDHENLPDFYGAYKKEKDEDIEIWFVMEICDGGPVMDLVQRLNEKNRRMGEEHIAFILKETLKALIHLHKNHIIHRDVCGSNILLTKEGEVKLVDFGLSREVKSTFGKRGTCIGSVCWMAPEVVASAQSNNDSTYGNRADVWALGITAIELGDGKPPFQDMHPTRAMFQIVRNPPPTLYRPANWSEAYNDFISECLEKNPEYRPYMIELLDHPFIASVPENSHFLTQELKKINEDVGTPHRNIRKPESTIKSNLLKTSQDAPPERMFLEDLAAMENLSEDLILFELQERMTLGQFQTFVGDILLIINPNETQDIYNLAHHNRYNLKSQSENPPHIYSVADRAYQDALHHEIPQYIVLSGESGSGKSTNKKHLIDHLIFMGNSNNNNGEKIQEAVELFEALTNASTPTNPDSTRCITKTDITFGASGKVTGAIFNIYQLEKWRISSIDMEHANFHILYYFYDAMMATGQLNIYSLDPDRKYRYLRISENHDNPKEIRNNPSDNSDKFKKIFTESKILDGEHLDVIFKTLSAILNLGEICFENTEDDHANIENPEYCDKVAELLSIENNKFSWALTNYCIIDKGTAVRRKNTSDQAREARDMLASCLYSRLIDWILNIINYKMSQWRAVYGDKFTISIVDMFGFECFERNDLEQLLINSINEQMQYHYIQRVFAWEQLEQIEEDMPITSLNYYDNKIAVDQLMGKSTGILSLIDEASRTGHSTQHILDGITKSSNTAYIDRCGQKEFSIAHYTGKVIYDITEMPQKNRDFLPPEMVETLRMSSNSHLRDFFACKLTRTGNLILPQETIKENTTKSKWSSALVAEHEKNNKQKITPENQYSQTRRMRTAITTFRAISLELLKELSVGAGSGGTHFIRCIRSDLKGEARGFHQELVKHQLRALSVLDTARARQNGYPHRIAFPEFLRRYKFLAFDFDENVEISQDNCRLLMVRLKMEGWKIGKTKVFLKYYNEEYLARLYETQVKKIVKVQAMMRAFLAKRNFAAKIKILKKRKSEAKLIRQQSDLGTEAAAALMIQKVYRGHVARKQYGPLIIKESGKIDKETADFIRPFAKKWRSKSMFQVLLQYRSAKYQDLVNFSQQLHIYNQNIVHELQKINHKVEVDKINQTANVDAWLGNKKPTVWKLPFHFDELPYYETQHMCDPLSGPSTAPDEDDNWDSPLQWRSSIIKEMKQKNYSTGRCKSPIYQKQNVGDQHLISVPYNRDPSSAIKKLPSIEPEKIRNRSSSHSIIQGENLFKKSEVIIGSPKNKPIGIITTPISQISSPQRSLERNLEGAKLANQDFEFIRSPNKPIQTKLRRGPGNPIAELESIGKKSEKNNDDEPPFNFQGMLRKTNFKRESLKRNEETREPQYHNVLRNKGKDSNIYENENSEKSNDNIIRYEVAPGIFLEGKESLL